MVSQSKTKSGNATESIEKKIEEGQKVAETALANLSKYDVIVIETNEEYTQAADLLKDIKGVFKTLDEEEKKLTKPLTEAHRAAMELFRAPKAKAKAAEQRIKGACVAYKDARDREAREEQERLDEIARQEQAKLDRAHQKKIERAEAKGDSERVAELIGTQPIVPTQVVESPVEKIEGLSYKETWLHQIMDEEKFFAACLTSAKLRRFISIDEKALAAYAKAEKQFAEVPGVRFYKETSAASSSR